MRRRTASAVVLALAGGIVGGGVSALPASALSAGIPFAAEASSTWQANNIAYAVGSVGGVVAVGGTFNQISPPAGGTGTPQNRAGLALLNADTGAPTACQFTLTSTSGSVQVRAIARAQTGNTLFIGGNFTAVNGTNRSRIAAIDPVACTLLPFNVAGIGGLVHSLYPAPNGTLYFGGEFSTVAGSTRNRAAAVNASTGAITPFDPNLRSTDVLDPNDPRVTTLPVTLPDGFALSPDGTNLAMGGEFDLVNGTIDSHALAILNPTTGVLTKAYPMFDRVTNPTGVWGNRDSMKTMTSDSTGFYVGSEGAGGGTFDGRAAFDWSTLDFRWKDTCLGATQAVLIYNNVLYGANHAHDCSSIGAWQGDERQHFTAQPIDAANFNKFYGWFPDTNEGIGEGIGPRGINVATGTSGRLWFWSVGEFTKVNGANQQSITRFGTTDSNAPAAPAVSAQAIAPGQVQVRFRSAYDTDDSLLTYRVYRNGSTTPIWTGTASSYFWTRPQLTFVDTTVTAGTAYSYRVSVSDASGNTSALSTSVSATASSTARPYASAVLADHPTFWWRYDETSGVWLQDKSGQTTTGMNGLYGTPGGFTRGVAGAIPGDASTAVTFDGTTAYVWEDQFVVNPTTFSAETWFKTTTTSGGVLLGYGDRRESTDTHTVAGFGGGGSNTFDDQVFMSDDGKLNFGVVSGTPRTLSSTNSYNDGGWHHVVASLGSAGTKLAVDGQVVASDPSVTAGTRSFRGVWHVGFDRVSGFGRPFWSTTPTSGYFNGTIDETAVYPTQLSDAAVAGHYGAAGNTPGDTTAPTPPTGASATISGSTVALSWTAATDDVAVTGYNVYRSTTSGFTPSSSTLVGTSTSTSYTDSGVAAGTSYYQVVALDAAGNASTPSNEASVTRTVTTTTVTLTPTEDTFVASNAATTNYGTGTQLSSRGTPELQTYLRYALPSLPSGATLTGATLRVRTSGDATAGSTDSFAVGVLSGSWSEASTTWTNRPSGVGSSIGSLSGATAVNSTYTATLDAAQLQSLMGASTSLAMTSTGSDNVRFWSREYATANYRPTLTLTYTS